MVMKLNTLFWYPSRLLVGGGLLWFLFIVEVSLLSTRYVSCLMAIWWMVCIVYHISDVGLCRFSWISMFLVWMAPLTLAVLTMTGLMFRPCALIASTNGLHLSSFVCMAWSRNISCVKVKSMISMLRSSVSISGPICSYAPLCKRYMILVLRGNPTM